MACQRKTLPLSTEDMVLWQRVTSKVTPLKSTTKPVTSVNLGADVNKRQNKFLKRMQEQEKWALDGITVSSVEAAQKRCV